MLKLVGERLRSNKLFAQSQMLINYKTTVGRAGRYLTQAMKVSITSNQRNGQHALPDRMHSEEHNSTSVDFPPQIA